MSENKQLCVIHANCQGEPLAGLLQLSAEFSRNWDVRHYTNYTREIIPDADLERCGLFIYQHLGEKWGEFSSAALLARLNSRARPLYAAPFCLPNMYFTGGWPFLVTDIQTDYADTFLNALIDQQVEKAVILKLYLHTDITKFVDLDASLAETFRQGEERERCCSIQVMPLVREQWKRRPLFHTVNHPGKLLCALVANAVLAELGLEALPEALVEAFTPEYANFDMPIHPQVAAYYGLNYGQAGHEFNIFGRLMTFERYVSGYIECRKQGMYKEFWGFMQLV
ncbi:MAG: hypothetical protein LBV80_02660 [Deltaproteobacteria bacterium]|jgi:hypothetical protein|nr:hypothetical protein [Deltaproteobacteria bacterium]